MCVWPRRIDGNQSSAGRGIRSVEIQSIGAPDQHPLPIGNTRAARCFKRSRTCTTMLLLRQTELNVRQDVASAIARLEVAERRATQTKGKLIPELQQALADMEKLFLAAEPGVDVLKVIDIRRKLLRARDNYLDALWSVRQARADVLAATGEPALEWGRAIEEPKAEVPPAAIGTPRP